MATSQSNTPGVEYTYQADADNYSPARATVHGTLTVRPGAFTHSPGFVVTFDPAGDGIATPESAFYFLSGTHADGLYYVAGWSTGDSITPRMVFLHPIPTAHGQTFGPRKTYVLVCK